MEQLSRRKFTSISSLREIKGFAISKQIDSSVQAVQKIFQDDLIEQVVPIIQDILKKSSNFKVEYMKEMCERTNNNNTFTKVLNDLWEVQYKSVLQELGQFLSFHDRIHVVLKNIADGTMKNDATWRKNNPVSGRGTPSETQQQKKEEDSRFKEGQKEFLEILRAKIERLDMIDDISSNSILHTKDYQITKKNPVSKQQEHFFNAYGAIFFLLFLLPDIYNIFETLIWKEKSLDFYKTSLNQLPNRKFSDFDKKDGVINCPDFRKKIVERIESTNITNAVIKSVRDICNVRVEEGEFINTSLKGFRSFISMLLSVSKLSSVPSFSQPCVWMQCSPFASSCSVFPPKSNSDFNNHHNNYNQQSTHTLSEKVKFFQKTYTHESSLMFALAKLFDEKTNDPFQTLYENNLIFTIFNVVNLDPVASDPPKIQYIESSILQFIAQSFSEHSLKQIRVLFEQWKDKQEESIQTIFSLSSQVNKVVNALEADSRSTILLELKELILLLQNHNAATILGTMDFMDLMAKFAQCESVCELSTALHLLGMHNLITTSEDSCGRDVFDTYIAAQYPIRFGEFGIEMNGQL